MNAASLHLDPARRHDFVLLFDVTDGNPNGDPDAGNLPRVDPETMEGLVTDVCVKRKVRNFVSLLKQEEAGYRIYVNDGGVALNALHEEAYEAEGLKSTGSKQKREDVASAREYMCRQFFDVRMFGAVMSTEVNCGQVRGPLQLAFGRSVDPVMPLDVAITRVAITRKQDAGVLEGDGDHKGEGKNKVTEMGRKSLVPYGLYRMHGFFSAPFAAQTGVTSEDLTLFWDALRRMWDVDRSASRGMMACRGLYVFTHENALGDAPAQDLFDRVSISRVDSDAVPRRFSDYSVGVDTGELPAGVTLSTLVS